MTQSNFKLILVLTTIIFLTTTFSKINAQEVQMSKEDSLGQVLHNVKSDLDLLKKLKITGYVQAQWQMADTIGSPAAFSGGNFPGLSDNRFKARRGRIKFLYGDDLNQFVMQFDVSEGGFSTKDVYFKVTDPFVKSFSLYGGIFNRPFGYEISYSSKERESPERARFTQTLFPQERDMGAQITFNPPKTSNYNFIHLDMGLFTGNGINAEFDSKKDFMAHLWVAKTTKSEKMKYGLGVSVYQGGVLQGNKYVYKMGEIESGVKGFVVDSTSTNKNSFANRQYIGFDGQISFESPAGLSVLRGEYVMGTQPGSNSTSVSPTNTVPGYDTYVRSFNAYYVYFVQTILQSKHQVVVKYDVYDPNSKVSGKEISTKINGKNTKLTTTDIRYATIGLGYIFHYNNNLKFTLYYDLVSNEKTSITGATGINNFTKDIKDNILTIRVQYKF